MQYRIAGGGVVRSFGDRVLPYIHLSKDIVLGVILQGPLFHQLGKHIEFLYTGLPEVEPSQIGQLREYSHFILYGHAPQDQRLQRLKVCQRQYALYAFVGMEVEVAQRCKAFETVDASQIVVPQVEFFQHRQLGKGRGGIFG